MPDVSAYLPALCGLLFALVLALSWRLVRQNARLNRQAAELRAARRQEALGTLAGGIAHDFNNILGAILGFGVLLEEDLITAPEQQDMARHITTAARRGQSIVAQLMRYSRHGAAEGAQDAEPVSLDAVIRENIALLTPCIRRSTHLSYRRAVQDDIIAADPAQIGQAIVNLCINADHAIGVRAGHIRITLDELTITAPRGEDGGLALSGGGAAGTPVEIVNGRLRKGRYLRIRVEDDGEGMTRDVAARIFDPFFTTREVGEGTGLGLAALQGIMQTLGGAILVSTTRFKGTVFDLMFPAAGGPHVPARR